MQELSASMGFRHFLCPIAVRGSPSSSEEGFRAVPVLLGDVQEVSKLSFYIRVTSSFNATQQKEEKNASNSQDVDFWFTDFFKLNPKKDLYND